jgi:diketogulonate reductase-like aldo/keto reductase
MNNKIPNMLYGTAWKEESTSGLVTKAINVGFRGIDTANQRRHYFEAAVGNAIGKVMDEGVKREDLFIQTKFTYAHGQDHRLPYDIDADFQTQVKQSFQSSLQHLRVDYIDSYLLHGPSSVYGLTDTDWKVWKEMESICKEGKVKYLGISNVNFNQLVKLYTESRIKPKFVQNRCFANTGWDKQIRQYCKEHNIIYQGFSLLTANSNIFSNNNLRKIILRSGKTPAQVIFRFAIQKGMIPLTGTKDETHMREDLSCVDFSLSEEDVRFIEGIGL